MALILRSTFEGSANHNRMHYINELERIHQSVLYSESTLVARCKEDLTIQYRPHPVTYIPYDDQPDEIHNRGIQLFPLLQKLLKKRQFTSERFDQSVSRIVFQRQGFWFRARRFLLQFCCKIQAAGG